MFRFKKYLVLLVVLTILFPFVGCQTLPVDEVEKNLYEALSQELSLAEANLAGYTKGTQAYEERLVVIEKLKKAVEKYSSSEKPLPPGWYVDLKNYTWGGGYASEKAIGNFDLPSQEEIAYGPIGNFELGVTIENINRKRYNAISDLFGGFGGGLEDLSAYKGEEGPALAFKPLNWWGGYTTENKQTHKNIPGLTIDFSDFYQTQLKGMKKANDIAEESIKLTEYLKLNLDDIAETLHFNIDISLNLLSFIDFYEAQLLFYETKGMGYGNLT